MSILRGVFQSRTNEVKEAPEENGVEGSEDSGESVTAALARLRKLHNQSGGAGVAIKQPLHAPSEAVAEVAEAHVAPEVPEQSMWDVGSEAETAPVETPPPAAVAVPSTEEKEVPPSNEARVAPRRAGRTRTRLLGFEHSNGSFEDVDEAEEAPVAAPVSSDRFAVGWVVIVDGPGRGHSFALNSGASQIGRDPGQAIPLDFGDMAISSEGHAMIAYDEETRAFYLGHSGKQNIVRLNDKPVLGTETVNHGDVIRIGETSLKVAVLCGADFSWSQEADASAKPSE